MWTTVWRTVVAHVQTWRPYTLCYPALVGAAGAGVAGADRAVEWAVAAAGPALGLGDRVQVAVVVVADVVTGQPPQRPIPSGRLSSGTALACGVGCALASGVLVTAANWRALLLFLSAMAGIVAYSRVCKGRGISGNLVRGLITTLAFLVGTMIGRPLPPWPALVLAVIFLLHDTSSNLVGAIRDVEGDRAGGYRSVPARHGVPFAARLALALYGTAIGVGAVAVALPLRLRADYAVLLVLAAGLGLTAVSPLLRLTPATTQVRALRAHKLLVVERLVLAAAVLAAGAPIRGVLLVLVPVVLFSAVTQAAMRSRHELPPTEPDKHRKAYQT
jgi:geranylgeranylglycerol-phosphate geranylgeranyltransferase